VNLNLFNDNLNAVESIYLKRKPVKIAAPAHLTVKDDGNAGFAGAKNLPCARGINASMHIIACVEDLVAIEKILKHLKEKEAP
jgi:hypothetical protein|tara:strand:- start:160 stop:408 length:249 start_codon:yes stop_codon:yes gene_type:complete